MSELTDSDRQHLDLLRICHFVKAGLWAMGCLAGGFYMFMSSFVGEAIGDAGPRPGDGPTPDQISGPKVW